MAPRPPGVYFDLIGEAIQLIKQDVGTWVLAGLLTLALGYGAMMVTNMVSSIVSYGSVMAPQMTVSGFLLQTVFGFFSTAVFYCFYTGMMQMALDRVDGKRMDVSVLFTTLKSYPQMLIAVTLYTLAMYLGMLVLVIPGLFVAGALAFAPMLVARRGLSGMDAISTCWAALKPHGFAMFGFLFVVALISVAGIFACVVGLLFTFPVYAVAMALQYRVFFPDEGEAVGQPIGMEPPKW